MRISLSIGNNKQSEALCAYLRDQYNWNNSQTIWATKCQSTVSIEFPDGVYNVPYLIAKVADAFENLKIGL